MAGDPETGTTTEARYKIGEVCRLADVQPYVLRYWENEFPVLAGDRSQPGPRTYTERDLKIVQRIKTLLYVEGFTIAGAKKRLEAEMRAGDVEGQSDTAPVPALRDEAVPPPVPEPKPRRTTKTRPVPAAAKEGAAELPEIFEETVGDADAPAPAQPKVREGDVRTGVIEMPTDPRLATVVSELKEILAILSRKP